MSTKKQLRHDLKEVNDRIRAVRSELRETKRQRELLQKLCDSIIHVAVMAKTGKIEVVDTPLGVRLNPEPGWVVNFKLSRKLEDDEL